ncbi:hypothetical protein DRF62_10065 [Chryseobacterium piscium]|uniref:SMI1/KNR4 family protein n=1 Tax=Chryseobacterium piscium TaxID=333702 RepID=A0A3D9BLK3_9FLAO|nr:hypothetical protein [Chryseobacterium piscium]REC54337.1 hypothetical protein DRF62_10065 [Chryseobacterium piscium]
MNREDYIRISRPLVNSIKQNNIISKGGNGPRSTESFGKDFFDKYKYELPSSLFIFYKLTNGFSDYWEATISTRTEGQKTSERGIINILPLDELFQKHSVIELEAARGYYIKGEDSFSKTGQFIPVDYVEDICAGVFSKENEDEIVYFHDFGIGFYPLKVNFEGYVELAFAARGYLMWQYVIVYLEYGKDDSAMYGKSRYDDFIEDMPLLFPDFKIDEFIKLYESLKIK